MRSWRNRSLALFLLGVLALAACDRLPNPAADPASGIDLSDPEVGGGAGIDTGPQTPVPPATPTNEASPRLDGTSAAGATFPTPTPTAEPTPAPTREPTAAAPTPEMTLTPTPEAPVATPTPEPSPAATETATETGETESSSETIHVVQPGENLYRIGLQYGLSWVVIAEYNGITDPNAIVVGQELRIPPAPTPTTAAPESVAPDDEGLESVSAEPLPDEPVLAEAAEAAAPTEPADTPTVSAAPAAADEPIPSDAVEDTHTVATGDTLYSISRRYGVSWAQVAEANGLATPNQIYAGQVLKIPVDAPGPTPEFTHRVHGGDTLTRIARQYGLSLTTLAEANGLTAPYVIYPGQELVIPGE